MNWPMTLPDIRLPLSHSRQDGTIRTQMEAGPEKVRRRFSAVTDNYRIQMRMTGSQYATLLQFHGVSLGQGALRFNFTDPLSGTTEEFRFVSPPSASVVTGANNPNNRILNVNFELEKLP